MRRFRLPRVISSAYATFWQTYTGRVDTAQLAQHFGVIPGVLWRTLFEVLTVYHWLDKSQHGFTLTPTGRDHYHDLEQWVTYRLIEPLWAEMMKEHLR